MKQRQSGLKISWAINYLERFCPIKIYYNGECIWDDLKDKSFDEAFTAFYKKNIDVYSKINIFDIKIEITEFHHSIIYLEGAVVND